MSLKMYKVEVTPQARTNAILEEFLHIKDLDTLITITANRIFSFFLTEPEKGPIKEEILSLQKLIPTIMEVKKNLRYAERPPKELTHLYECIGLRKVEVKPCQIWTKEAISQFATRLYVKAFRLTCDTLDEDFDEIFKNGNGIDVLLENFFSNEEFLPENFPEFLKDYLDFYDRILEAQGLFSWNLLSKKELSLPASEIVSILKKTTQTAPFLEKDKPHLLKFISEFDTLDHDIYRRIQFVYNIAIANRLFSDSGSFSDPKSPFAISVATQKHLFEEFTEFCKCTPIGEISLDTAELILKNHYQRGIGKLRKSLEALLDRPDLQKLFTYVMHLASYEVFLHSDKGNLSYLKEFYRKDLSQKQAKLSKSLLVYAKHAYRFPYDVQKPKVKD